MSAENRLRAHLENPYLVLGLAPGAGGAAIEREGEKLLAMLAAGLDEVGQYATPLGPRPLTPELVRSALAALRDPAGRLRHEWWARGWQPS